MAARCVCSTADTFDSLDEGAGFTTTDSSVFATTGDGLVGLKRVGGVDGGTLVPDLATSLPIPTNGGRTYTFQLRPGIHYSNGDPVRASDLRRALERAFRVGPAPVVFFGALVGADACWKSDPIRPRESQPPLAVRGHTPPCDLSRGVVANDRAATVTLHLREPDPDLFYKLASPFGDLVPPEVSMTRPARLGVPGTGPYMIQSYKKSRLVLVRNPRFREWYAAAQPNGYPDRIVVTYTATRPTSK